MQPSSTSSLSRKFLITFTVLLIVFGAAVLMGHHSTPKATNISPDSGKVTTKTDPASKQTVTTINGETQNGGQTGPNASLDDPAQNPTSAYYLGINDLLNHGVTSDQAANMEDGFSYYFKQAGLNPQQVSIAVDTIRAGEINQDTDQPINTLDFDTVFDEQTTVHAQLQYYGLSSTRLLIFDKNSGSQVYDSGTINTMR